jgi:hypothetical protein
LFNGLSVVKPSASNEKPTTPHKLDFRFSESKTHEQLERDSSYVSHPKFNSIVAKKKKEEEERILRAKLEKKKLELLRKKKMEKKKLKEDAAF